jgi:hypothetical protein
MDFTSVVLVKKGASFPAAGDGLSSPFFGRIRPLSPLKIPEMLPGKSGVDSEEGASSRAEAAPFSLSVVQLTTERIV